MVTRPLEAARIFISCGQNNDTDEARIASEIKIKTQSLGFDPYVAIDVQTLQGLKESNSKTRNTLFSSISSESGVRYSRIRNLP
jgi:hypothetical protein